MAIAVLFLCMAPWLALAVEAGQPAPEFNLPGSTGGDVALADFRGRKWVLIEFYGADFAPTCTGNLLARRADYKRFEALGIPRAVVTLEHPAPVGQEGQQDPDRFSGGSRKVCDRRVCRDHEIERADDGRGFRKIGGVQDSSGCRWRRAAARRRRGRFSAGCNS